jgi:hypothetical protein
MRMPGYLDLDSLNWPPKTDLDALIAVEILDLWERTNGLVFLVKKLSTSPALKVEHVETIIFYRKSSREVNLDLSDIPFGLGSIKNIRLLTPNFRILTFY